MLKQEDSGHGLMTDTNNWIRTCDTCRSAACTVYCRADSAYLCSGCDARIHAVNNVASHHERVWVCEACERAPAAFLCKADAASLCTACDSDIHSANPLARRHHRVPILPIAGALYGPPANIMDSSDGTTEDGFLTQETEETIIDDDDEAASWLLLDPVKNTGNNNNNHNESNNNNNNNGVQFDGEVVDEYLDLVDYTSCQENQFGDHNYKGDHEQMFMNFVPQKGYEGDSVVPVNYREGKDQLQLQLQQPHHSFHLGLQYEGYPTSTAYSVSVSCMDVGVVPESSISDLSNPNPKGITTTDLFSGPQIQMPQQLNPLDREARVLRYREKKKNRKFEKTIRYASRKAYAETRPRIKGRFAKRTDVEVDQLLSEAAYGIVPSF